jgi:Leucine-rich repeat (LRR) protein
VAARSKPEPVEPEPINEEITSAPRAPRGAKQPIAPEKDRKGGPGRSKSRASAAEDASGEFESEVRASKKTAPQRKGPSILLGSGVTAIVGGYLGAIAAAYFGLIGYQPKPIPPYNNSQDNNRQADPPQQFQPGGFQPGGFQPMRPPGPRPRVPANPVAGIPLPARNPVEEAEKAAEREKQRKLVAATEQQILAALSAPPAGQEPRGPLVLSLPHKQPVTHLAFAPDGHLLASIARDRTIKIWDLKTGTIKHTLPGNSPEGGELAFSPDGRTLASTCAGEKVQLWDVQAGQLLRELLPAQPHPVRGVVFSPDGRWVGAGGQSFDRWDTNTGQPIPNTIRDRLDASVFALRPDGKSLIAKWNREELYLWDLDTGSRYDFGRLAPAVAFITFSPDNWKLAWIDPSPRSPVPVHVDTIGGHGEGQPNVNVGSLTSIAFSPDGKTLAIGGSRKAEQGALQLVDVASSHQERGRAEGRELGEVKFLSYSPGGTFLATVDSHATIRIWVVADLLAKGPPPGVLADLKKSVTLERVGRIFNVELKQTATDDILAELAKLNGLRGLSLGSCENLTEQGLAGLKGLKALRYLDLSTAEPTTHVTDAWLAQLKELPNLQELRLGGCAGITDAGLAHLAGLKQLAKLDLSNSGITSAGLAQLQGLTSLQELNLYGTAVTDAGLQALNGLTKLSKLDLGATAVTDAGLANLAGLKELTTLSLGSLGDLKGPGLKHLKGLAKLTELNLISTRISDADLAAVGPLASLETLYLMQTPVSDAGLPHLYGLKKLQTIGLTWTKVTDEGVEALKKALPQTDVSK